MCSSRWITTRRRASAAPQPPTRSDPVTAADAAARLREQFAVEPTVDGSLVTAAVAPEQWQPVARFVRSTLGCLYFSFLTAVDWKEQGMEILCRVENLDARLAVMLRTRLADGDDRCSTLCGIWRGADWVELEWWDMFGGRCDYYADSRLL